MVLIFSGACATACATEDADELEASATEDALDVREGRCSMGLPHLSRYDTAMSLGALDHQGRLIVNVDNGTRKKKYDGNDLSIRLEHADGSWVEYEDIEVPSIDPLYIRPDLRRKNASSRSASDEIRPGGRYVVKTRFDVPYLRDRWSCTYDVTFESNRSHAADR